MEIGVYTYKCYNHPKIDSKQPCRGCKLPMCPECQDSAGFCPECGGRRAMVQHLKEFRGAMLANAHKAGTTTGRLRLVRRQMLAESQAPRRSTKVRAHSPSRPLPELALGQLATRPLRDAAGRPLPARAEDGAIARQIRDQILPAPVVRPRPPHSIQPDTFIERPARPRPARKPVPRQVPKQARWSESWWVPFASGLGVGLVLLLLALALLQRPHHAPVRLQRAELGASAMASRAHSAQDAASLVAPGVQLRFPRPGQRLRGLQYLKASLGAPQRFSSLVLLVDGQALTSTTAVAGNTALALDTRRLSNGRHTFQLEGYAWQELIAESAVLPVIIAN